MQNYSHSSQDTAATTILLYEGNSIAGGLIARTLGVAGYRVQLVANGEDFLASYRRDHPDAAIVGFPTPDGEGLVAIKRLTTEFPRAVVILLAAECQMEAYRNVSPSVGARKTLGKPCAMTDLLAAIDEELRAKVLPVF